MEVGGYRIIRLLNSGSASTAFLGRRKKDGKEFVLKHIMIKGKESQRYAFNEVTVLSSLVHPHILKYCDNFFETRDAKSFWIVTEYCERGDLAQYIDGVRSRRKRLSEKRVLEIFSQVCSALHYVHHHKVIHRDIKASNIFIARDGTIKLGDFGISCRVREHEMHDTQVGSPIIASPEVFESKEYDYKTDIWSLGCVLYQLVTRELPFQGDNIFELKIAVTKGKYKPIPPMYSTDLRKLIAKMLSKDPSKRPTIDEILNSSLLKSYQSLIIEKEPTPRKKRMKFRTVEIVEQPYYEVADMDVVFLIQIFLCNLLKLGMKLTNYRPLSLLILASKVSFIFYILLLIYVLLFHIK